MRYLLILLMSALLWACAPQETTTPENEGTSEPAKSLEEQREEAIANFDHEACQAKGGEMRIDGLLGMPRCTIPYADAGAPCTDHSDCEGRCLNDDSVTDYDAPPGEARGLCEADDSPFGCYAEIENGTLAPAICVD